MIIIENRKVEGIPVLHLADKEKFNEQLPFIVFVHGFTSAKEHNLHYAYLLAEKGFRVVLPEALYHGERSTGLSGNDLNVKFWEIVLTEIEELNEIKNAFASEGLIDEEKIGLAGTSMGGIVTMGALTRYDWIKTAVSLMGMPYYEKFALWQIDELKKHGIDLPFKEEELAGLLQKLKELDISQQPEKLAGRPILFWHGKQDQVVPYHYTYHFYESIRTNYEEMPEKLVFLTDENAGHKVSREGLLKTVEWFETYLGEGTSGLES
jgi:uncharacterized protein